ncbi:co-chaperone GroES [Fusobacterium sp.]|uniref:co-chaperone GroES n=1 Tax=Fusobacterium sp. TaxID=68766 RepID=UPI00396C400F
MNIKPIGKRVLVKLIKEEEKTASGIILPGAGDKEKPNLGEVIAVGTGEDMPKIEIGEKVIYAKYSGTEIKDGDEKYLILNIEDVLAVIE